MSSITTATDVAEMYEALQDAQLALRISKEQLAIVTQERETLQARLTVATRERDDEMVRATQLNIILEATSMSLVQGLSKMKEEARTRNNVRRIARQEELEVIEQEHDDHEQAPQERVAPAPRHEDPTEMQRPPQRLPAAPDDPPEMYRPLRQRRPADVESSFLRGARFESPDQDKVYDERLPRVTLSEVEDRDNLLAVADRVGAR